MKHYFSVKVAEEVGVPAAVIFENIAFWIKTNERNGRNIHDGKAWMFSSVSSFKETFPYFSEKQIRNSLSKLFVCEFLTVGNYNKTQYDRTRWFALTEKGNSFVRNDEKDLPKRANGNARKGEPIPDIKKHTRKKIEKGYINENEQDFSLDPFSL